MERCSFFILDEALCEHGLEPWTSRTLSLNVNLHVVVATIAFVDQERMSLITVP